MYGNILPSMKMIPRPALARTAFLFPDQCWFSKCKMQKYKINLGKTREHVLQSVVNGRIPGVAPTFR